MQPDDVVVAGHDELHNTLPPTKSPVTLRLATSSFRLFMGVGATMYAYRFKITPEPAGPKELRELLEKSFCGKLKKLLPSGRIFVRFPGRARQEGCHGHVFAANEVVGQPKISEQGVELLLQKEAEYPAEVINKALFGGVMCRRVGKKYWSAKDPGLGDKAEGPKIVTFAGMHTFVIGMNTAGPQLSVNTLSPSITKSKENAGVFGQLTISEPGVELLLRKVLEYSAERSKRGLFGQDQVLANYVTKKPLKFLIYPKVGKKYHSSQDPFLGDESRGSKITTLAGVHASLMTCMHTAGPQLQLNTLLPPNSKSQGNMLKVVGAILDLEVNFGWKTFPIEECPMKLDEWVDVACSDEKHVEVAEKASESDERKATHAREDWQRNLAPTPTEVDARNVRANREVNFGWKTFPIEECPMKLDEWVDVACSDEKHVEVAEKASESDERKAIHAREDWQRNLAPTPTEVDARNVRANREVNLGWKTFPIEDEWVYVAGSDEKHVELAEKASESDEEEAIHARRSTAALLSQVVLQMNAKVCGPRWQMEWRCPVTAPLFEEGAMVIGIHPDNSNAEVPQYLGFAASLDAHCAEFYSSARRLLAAEGGAARGAASAAALRRLFRSALIEFHGRNGLLPGHVIVYRAGYKQEDEQQVREAEVKAFWAAIEAVEELRGAFAPELTFITIAKPPAQRLSDQKSGKGPDPGTVADDAEICGSGQRRSSYCFYLINQQATGEAAAAEPALCTVLEEEPKSPRRRAALTHLTHRLSFLYYDNAGSVKLPAPVNYAKKIAHFVATAPKKALSKRLLNTFFYP